MTAAVVAIEVQAGTPGRAVAQSVAARLGYSYHEEDLLMGAASNAGVSTEVMQAVERVPSFFIRMGEVLELGRNPDFQTDLSGVPELSGGGWLMAKRNRAYLEQSVRRVASQGGCVIVGHAAQVLLKQTCPGLFTVLIHGSIKARAGRYAGQHDLDLVRAEAFVRAVDRQEAEYLKQVYHVDADAPDLYDLSVSTDCIDVTAAAELIVAGACNVPARRARTLLARPS